MMKKRLSYPRTTPSQRQHLFEIWEETGDKKRALSESRVSERTFYYWKPRFEIFRKRFNHREHGEHRESQSFLPPLWAKKWG